MNASIGTKSNRDGVAYNKSIKEKTTVLASQIADLANNEFYFKNGSYNWTHIKTEFIPSRDLYPIINEHFIQRDELLLENIDLRPVNDISVTDDNKDGGEDNSVGW
jgi:hypothetical protein